jgi:itaconyl-CoA hydratase
MRMPSPLFEGDTVYSQSEVLAARPSQSRPDVGVVTVRTVGFTAEGRIVITFERTLLVYRRGHGPRFADVRPEWDPRSLAAAGLPVEESEPS